MPPRRTILARRGSIYILALGVSTLVAVIGLSALMTIRANHRQARQTADRAAAQSLAMSAVEHALAAIDAEPDWRYVLKHDVASQKVALGQGTFSWKLVDDADADLADDETQEVRLVGIGRSGKAVQMYAVRLRPVKTPLGCLGACLYGNGSITWNGASVRADGFAGTNASMSAVSAIVNAPVRAVGTISGSTYNDERLPNSDPLEMPGPVAAFDHYLLNGTEVPLGGLLLESSGLRVLERVAIGPNRNPLGLTNEEGIYVIRCAGAPVIVRNCRIVGTLVLLDPGVGSRIEGSVNWEPAIATYPALMVRGSMDFAMTTDVLSESSGGSNVNFNPTGMPYNGSEDADTDDDYPSIMKGIVYVSEKLTNGDDGIRVEGMVVVGTSTSANGAVNLTYRRDIYQDAPPGFYHMNKVIVVPKSWQQQVQ